LPSTLFSEAKVLNNLQISFRVFSLQVFLMMAALPHQLQQPPPRAVVMFMHFQVVLQLVNPGGQKGNLHR
jgi:hypothetical protein